MKTRNYLILMAALILLPVILFASLGLNMLLLQERESRFLAVEEIARATALAIDQEIAQAQGSLNVLANTPFFKTEDFGSLHALMAQVKGAQNTWNIVYDYGGNQQVNSVVPFGTPLPATLNPRVARLIDSQAPHVSNLLIGELQQVPIIAASMPVALPNGKKYLVSQIFRLDYFNSLLNSPSLSSSWIVGLFDADGISLARTPDRGEMVGKPVRSDLYLASLQGFSGRTRHITRDNIAVYSVFTHTVRTGWTVAIGVPEEEIEAPARRAAWYAALVMGVMFAMVTFITLYLARHLTRSLDHAVDAAGVLGTGGVPVMQPSRVAEVDVLQSALHQAGAALSRENSVRLALEQERESLLRSEKAARQQAENQNRAKDEFLAMLGHELRNPLAPISTAAQLLKAPGADSHRVRICGEIIDRQVTHMTELVNDLLDVSRVTRGLVALDMEDLDIQSAISSAIEQVRPVIDARRHELVMQLDPSPAWVHGNCTRLIQVTANLLNNAAKYTPEGGRIVLSLQVLETELRMAVSDNGIGIAPGLLMQVFDLFTQAERTPDRAQGGLGLGLTLVKSLVALHGGQVEAHSQGLGQGSTFTVILPRLQRTG